MRLIILSSLLLLVVTLARGQEILTGMSSFYSDSFVEWILFSDIEDQEGELEIRWKIQNDFTQWNYNIGEQSGRIQQVWKDDPTQWEVRSDNGRIITMQIRWRGDVRQWRITDNKITLNLRTKYSNLLDEWEVEKNDYGHYAIYTAYEGDPRDWEIVDELDDRVSFSMRIALAFIAMYHATPKI